MSSDSWTVVKSKSYIVDQPLMDNAPEDELVQETTQDADMNFNKNADGKAASMRKAPEYTLAQDGADDGVVTLVVHGSVKALMQCPSRAARAHTWKTAPEEADTQEMTRDALGINGTADIDSFNEIIALASNRHSVMFANTASDEPSAHPHPPPMQQLIQHACTGDGKTSGTVDAGLDGDGGQCECCHKPFGQASVKCQSCHQLVASAKCIHPQHDVCHRCAGGAPHFWAGYQEGLEMGCKKGTEEWNRVSKRAKISAIAAGHAGSLATPLAESCKNAPSAIGVDCGPVADTQEMTHDLEMMFSKLTFQEDTATELQDHAAKTQDVPADAVEAEIQDGKLALQKRTVIEHESTQDKPAKKKQRKVWEKCANPTCNFTCSNYNQSKWLHCQVTFFLFFNNS